ncbi:MAG: hypothetical protein CVV42_12780 [Candidatus Riflebacteria bacterium HGW-Riflebacteria-2]|jgi:hypothetical protein|nr:MAG: hypothetical protein CVV42_12780 [Candidatus Riflebacteria bacterium HGW-Riflebacteria-2]
MRTTNYIEGLLLFAALVLFLLPVQELNSARDVPLSVIVAIGSYGLLLIARRPRHGISEPITTRSRRTAWYLAMTGVVLGVIMHYVSSTDSSGFFASNAIYVACLYYGLALSMLVFSFINRQNPEKRNEHNYLPKHRFNTLELSI